MKCKNCNKLDMIKISKDEFREDEIIFKKILWCKHCGSVYISDKKKWYIVESKKEIKNV